MSAYQLRQLALSLRVDSARGLVKNEQVGLDREHGSEPQTLTLATREIAWVPPFATAESQLAEPPASPPQIAIDPKRDFLFRSLADDVSAGILGEVAGAPMQLDLSFLNVEESTGQLGERGLAAAVRAGESDDFAATKLE